MFGFIIGISTTHLIYTLISKEYLISKFTNLDCSSCCNDEKLKSIVENNNQNQTQIVGKNEIEQILLERKRKLDQFCEYEMSENPYIWNWFASKSNLLLQKQANFTFCM